MPSNNTSGESGLSPFLRQFGLGKEFHRWKRANLEIERGNMLHPLLELGQFIGFHFGG